MITTLLPHQIFVFGSNLQGRHDAGAAKYAVDHFGAVYGKGVGIQGQSYAIPTMEGLELMGWYIQDFLEYASLKPELTFLVTPIGTGIAGHSAKDVAQFFKEVPENVILPREFN